MTLNTQIHVQLYHVGHCVIYTTHMKFYRVGHCITCKDLHEVLSRGASD